MLRKLFKYDFKTLGRTLLPLYAATFVVGIFSSLLSRLFNDNSSAFILNQMSAVPLITTVLYFILFGSTCIMSIVISISHYKNSMLGKQGYLTHSLPLSNTKKILSKALSSSLWQIITMIFASFSMLLSIMIRYSMGISWYEISYGIAKIIDYFNIEIAKQASIIILQLSGLMLCGIIIIISTNLMFYASLSVGYIANNKKDLLSFAVFIGFYIISQFINLFAIMHYNNIFGEISTSLSFNSYLNGYSKIFIPLLLYGLFYAFTYFFITNYCISRKLNLE